MKKIFIYVAVVAVMLSCAVVPAFASENEVVDWVTRMENTTPYYWNTDMELVPHDYDPDVVLHFGCSIDLEAFDFGSLLPAGDYIVAGNAPDCVSAGESTRPPLSVYVMIVDAAFNGDDVYHCNFGDVISIPDGLYGVIVAQSEDVPPVLYRLAGEKQGIYQEVENMLTEYFFGGAELSTPQQFAVSVCSMACCLAILAIPFLLVYLLIRFMLRW